MSYNLGYRIGNLMDQQKLAAQGHMNPYGLQNYNPIPMGANGQAPGMEGVVPAYGSSTPSYKPGQGVGGQAGAIAMAAPQVIMDTVNAFKKPDYDTSITAGDWSGYNLQHGLGDEIAKSRAYKESQEGMITKSTLSNTAKYAATGASIGSVFPGFGTAIGAGVGAIVGSAVGFFGGRRRKKKGGEQIAALDQSLINKMEDFSQANVRAKTEQQQKRIALAQYNA
jgi:hypothetical protein